MTRLRNSDLRQRRTSPIWFVAMVVAVSILGWMHRFQKADSQLFLSLQDGEEDFKPAEQRRSMLGGEKEVVQESYAQLRAEADQAKAEAAKAKAAVEKLQQEVERATQALGEAEEKVKAVAVAEEVQQPEDEAEEQTTAVSTQQQQKSAVQDRKVYFMPWGQFDQKDAFSASWLQKKEDFLTMELHTVMICEDAAFRAFKGKRREKARMTLDWLDFSLEHLSKWWKMLKIFNQEEVYNTAMVRFDKYLAGAATFPIEEEQSFQETIAVIAFQPYRDRSQQEKAYNLTLKSLGATIESLRRAGFGRVVVVGDGEDDPKLSQDTFRHLHRQLEPKTPIYDATIISKVGTLEVGYAKFDPEKAKTKNLAKNVPRATLEGLKEAFMISEKTERTPEEQEHLNIWLGEKENWKYVYLTEPDSILQTRPSTLKQLKEEVDKGMVLLPHRLQPIPHESDARGTKEFLFLPEDEFQVTDLDSIGENDSCCDAHLGPRHKPGLPPNIESCGNFWYMCDFSRRKSREERTHKRIKEYSLIRLKQGTEIVSLASLEWGRPCIPKKNGVCLPPPDMALYK